MDDINNALLEKLNRFTRREHTADEVYIFSVTLCDNDIDRDFECFSLEALNDMKTLFIGRTGIFDHNAKGANQTARIFDTELITDSNRKNALGEDYVSLKGYAYMIRTDSNADLIREIDGGIKKEVSVSCAVKRQLCSVCGADIKKKPCCHVKGKEYSGKTCFVTLDGVSDAYEWSFVAVPAQKNAGVTKYFSGQALSDDTVKSYEDRLAEKNSVIDLCREDICAEVTRLAFLSKPDFSADTFKMVTDRMTLAELIALKKQFRCSAKSFSPKPMLCQEKHEAEKMAVGSYRI
jgi:hypothetical protein